MQLDAKPRLADPCRFLVYLSLEGICRVSRWGKLPLRGGLGGMGGQGPYAGRSGKSATSPLLRLGANAIGSICRPETVLENILRLPF